MIVMNEEESEIIFSEYDSADYTTNNRMELTAILCALGYAESHPNDEFIIFSDSAYAVNSCNVWMPNWAANGWRNSKKAIVENVDLMKALYSYLSRYFFNAEVRKCSGHTGEVGNELADAAATRNWNKYREIIDCWNITPEWLENKAGDNWYPID